MQLLIGACVIAFCTPIFHSSLEDFSENLARDKMDREIEGLLEVMNRVLSGDTGSRLDYHISVDGAGICGISKLRIGGPLLEGSERYLISYDMSPGPERKFTLDPPFPITSESNTTLELEKGCYRLWVELENNGEMEYLSVILE
jgi:hypothetical protein